MKPTTTLVAALLSVLGTAFGAAHAQEATQDFANQTLSVRSRADVLAELDRARQAGELERRNYAYGGYPRMDDMPSTLTRAEVLAEFDRARMAGELDRRNYTRHDTATKYAVRNAPVAVPTVAVRTPN